MPLLTGDSTNEVLPIYDSGPHLIKVVALCKLHDSSLKQALVISRRKKQIFQEWNCVSRRSELPASSMESPFSTATSTPVIVCKQEIARNVPVVFCSQQTGSLLEVPHAVVVLCEACVSREEMRPRRISSRYSALDSARHWVPGPPGCGRSSRRSRARQAERESERATASASGPRPALLRSPKHSKGRCT